MAPRKRRFVIVLPWLPDAPIFTSPPLDSAGGIRYDDQAVRGVLKPLPLFFRMAKTPIPPTPEPSDAPEKDETPETPSAPTPEPAPLTNFVDPAVGQLEQREISDVMEKSYLDYAMSVIVARALPDARDGLKPVHRRILYSMHEGGLRYTAKHKKSANVVGDVLGKYHPHGDSSVYDAMVRMAQTFSMRYPFVDGQGNFGSVDGDSPAAYRYTEAKLARISEEILGDIDKDTVDWTPTYDASRLEPKTLPSKLPNLLLNGSEGIAVGMATKIPPHNLGELIDAEIALIKDPEITTEALCEYVKGPDFPTGGVIFDSKEILNTYATGRGRITMRGVAEIVETKHDHHRIIITEIPYQVNKATLIEKMAELVRDKIIAGISDIRDESDDKIRVVIELKRDAYPKKVLNQLFKHTALQTAFHVNMIALADGLQPKLMNLKELLQTHVGHRENVVTRRTQFELRQAEERAHVLEGLKIALDHIDEVIATIRKSPTTEDAHAALMKKFKLSEIQASAILAMRLSALAGLERKKVEDELAEKLKLIAELKALLADRKKILAVVSKELIALKEAFGDERLTRVMKLSLKGFREEDLIPNEPMMITITKGNYIKRLPPSVYRSQHRGGVGVTGMQTKDEDSVELILTGNTHDEVLFFTNRGRVFKLKAYEIPLVGRAAKGQALVNLIQLAPEEKVTVITTSSGIAPGAYFFIATKRGTVKKTPVADYANVRASGLIAVKLKPGDDLTWVERTGGKDQILLVTRGGQCIRFQETDCRPMGRAATGVRGIKLAKDDEVVEMFIIRESVETGGVLVVSANGYGKRTKLAEYKIQNRAGSGIKVMDVTKKTGDVVGGALVTEDMRAHGEMLIASRQAQVIRTPLAQTPSLGRSTQGVILMRLAKGDRVASMDILLPETAPEESKAPAEGATRDAKEAAIVRKTAATARSAKKAKG